MEDMDLPDLDPVAISVLPLSSSEPGKQDAGKSAAHKRNRKRKRHNTHTSNSAMEVDVVEEKISPKKARWVCAEKSLFFLRWISLTIFCLASGRRDWCPQNTRACQSVYSVEEFMDQALFPGGGAFEAADAIQPQKP